MITLAVLKERDHLETRVAITPDVVLGIIKDKLADVLVEAGAGERAGFIDQDYREAGARVINAREELMANSDYAVAVNGTEFDPSLCGGKLVISLFDPYNHQDGIKELNKAQATVVALELIPRISRAQSMDVLSSQANIAGYVAVLFAASNLSKVMPLMMTAAGTIKPAKVLVLGAGVAGLAAIATAKRLGAVVHAYDVRSVVKEQIESLGAKFVDIKLGETGEGSGGYAKALSSESQAELREKLAQFAKDMDVVITTAQIPGKKAPRLLDERVYELMKSDAVFVDMASSSGGNVDGSKPNAWVTKGRVKIYGGDTMARMTPKDASFTFGKNIRSLLELMVKTESLDVNDEILRDAVLCHQGAFINQPFKDLIEGKAARDV